MKNLSDKSYCKYVAENCPQTILSMPEMEEAMDETLVGVCGAAFYLSMDKKKEVLSKSYDCVVFDRSGNDIWIAAALFYPGFEAVVTDEELRKFHKTVTEITGKEYNEDPVFCGCTVGPTLSEYQEHLDGCDNDCDDDHDDHDDDCDDNDCDDDDASE